MNQAFKFIRVLSYVFLRIITRFRRPKKKANEIINVKYAVYKKAS
ncbi:hypothetical protein SPACI_054190 [Sporomusa acidovorans DSM 3132]|uniref:Uncharacterized protein n=1 Tax=Sporomusa acidovorans (strain ATCC 49682 / DSM 3132 / Mol) TaxID=1123286 RepID=A0ABZ3JA55_SPOA4|nr:hypothetical protein SPACI_16960 [Sporomusa acidovorans DSM 3132]SDD62264.1 hypothetical protein SAMN04488499_1002245 [Sporomusa acidovorans]